MARRCAVPQQPAPWRLRNTLQGPRLERDQHRVLERILSRIEITADGDEGGDNPPPFLPNDPVDDRLGVLRSE